MELSNGQLIRLSDIDGSARPKLADMLALVEGTAYLLSAEPLSDEEGDERLSVLIRGEDSWGFIEDVPATSDGTLGEEYKAIVLDKDALDSLTKLIAPKVRGRKESTGRPPKYSMAAEGTSIFVKHVYEGKSIKSLANEYGMSPTTVQKLLNKARMKAAESILNGETTVSEDSDRRSKDLSVVEWAAGHSKGGMKQKFTEFLTNVSRET